MPKEVSELHDLYEVVDQLKALGFILRHTPDELPMEGQHAYGLGGSLTPVFAIIPKLKVN